MSNTAKKISLFLSDVPVKLELLGKIGFRNFSGIIYCKRKFG